MKIKEETFYSVSTTTKESLSNLAKRRGWKCDVKEKGSGKTFDVTLHIPEDFDSLST